MNLPTVWEEISNRPHVAVVLDNDSIARSSRRALIRYPPLERELQRELHQARRLRLDHIAEVGIENLPLHRGGAKELRMVEGVKRLEPELQTAFLPDMKVTQHGQIGVKHARPKEGTPRGSPGLAQRILG